MTGDQRNLDPQRTISGRHTLAKLKQRTTGSETPGLTVLAHPDIRRVGDQVALTDLRDGRRVELSRTTPEFGPPGAGATEMQGLAERHLSRQPLTLSASRASGTVSIERGSNSTDVVIGGRPLGVDRQLSAAELERGVVLLLSDRVALLLHTMMLAEGDTPRFDMIGEGRALLRLRRQIQRVAGLDVPALLLGETGSGKELVARALHEHGPRREAPFIPVNVAAIPGSLAASELFGAVKGAYTGADGAREGYFGRAHGGTLFLDEIADVPQDIQVHLLRALETQQIQPVGGDALRRVDVRVVAATDQDLEESVRAGRFRAPLLHRLNGYPIHVPPLRERREDIGRLLVHFLRQELQPLGGDERLNDAEARPPWLAARVVARLAGHDWPGNVRELRNVVRQVAIHSTDLPETRFPSHLERTFGQGEATAETETPAAGDDPGSTDKRRRYRHPGAIDEQELLAALRANAWRIKPTAAALNVSRTSLYALIEKCQSIRRASELSRDELETCLERCHGDVEAMAAELEVSAPGLKQRMTELELG